LFCYPSCSSQLCQQSELYSGQIWIARVWFRGIIQNHDQKVPQILGFFLIWSLNLRYFTLYLTKFSHALGSIFKMTLKVEKRWFGVTDGTSFTPPNFPMLIFFRIKYYFPTLIIFSTCDGNKTLFLPNVVLITEYSVNTYKCALPWYD